MDEREREAEQLGIPLDYVVVDKSDTRHMLALGAVVLVLAGAMVLLLVAGVGLVAAMFGVALLVVLGFFARKSWVAIRWQNPQLFLPSSRPLALGADVTARYRRRIRAGSGAAGASVTASLVCVEKATYQQGTDTHTARSEVYRKPVETFGSGEGRTMEADLRLRIPMFDAPPSMDLGNNEISWRLEVDLEAPEAPDDRATFPIAVAPEVVLP